MSAQRSIVIGGGAFAGLALAVALRQGLGPDIRVIVADPALGVRPSR
ncbi:MAG: 2-octaprenyl-6-methoxyphenyl hydroxylase, partial [Bradyrhizobium sp.]